MSDFIEDQKPIGVFEALEMFRSRPGDVTDLAHAKAPRTRDELASFVRKYFGMVVPQRALCPGHDSPLDYLAASFFGQHDLLVWANRGGGKTCMAAAATILDALFHSPSRIRVLGGSFDQSDRLAEYVRKILAEHGELISGKSTRQKVRLVTGSDIEMLAQSERAVRGQHVQKIRCDEVDLFDADVWRAVQFATRSAGSSRGSIEVLSTLHRPGGLMQKLVESAGRPGDGRPHGYKLIRWCLWDVIERCGPNRECACCPLQEDCRQIARQGSGFFSIDDAISIKARSSRASWQGEMLCLGVARDQAVFGEFHRGKHVRKLKWQRDWPTYRAIDFGYRNPLVCLWIQLSPAGSVNVIGEYIQSLRPITQHAAEILKRDRGPVSMTYVDPAGRQHEATSGAACTELLAAAGIPCSSRRSTIAEGLELIRAALCPASGEPYLAIDPSCTGLVEAMEAYHYGQPGRSPDDKPIKDGPDHAVDALRYFFVNRMRPKVSVGRANY